MNDQLQTQCSYCGDYKICDGAWANRNPRPHLPLSHGACPTCTWREVKRIRDRHALARDLSPTGMMEAAVADAAMLAGEGRS